jgi:hypothetical protein
MIAFKICRFNFVLVPVRPYAMELNIVYGTGENCDMIGGNRFFGDLEWDPSKESSEDSEEASTPMVGIISGRARQRNAQHVRVLHQREFDLFNSCSY